MKQLEKLRSGGNLGSKGNGDAVVRQVHNQVDFDELFQYLFHDDSTIVMLAAAAIEKIIVVYPFYL